MPVRSLSWPVLKWPAARQVDQAVRRWVAQVAESRPEITRVGYFGSYARGDWGVGSDLDLIIIVEQSELPPEPRAAQWDTTGLPVPVELLVYTTAEWERLSRQGQFHATVMLETVWVYVRGAGRGGWS